MPKFMDDDIEDTRARRNLAKEQTAMEIPLRSSSACCPPTKPWPKKNDSVTKKNAFAITKRKLYWKRPGQGNS